MKHSKDVRFAAALFYMCLALAGCASTETSTSPFDPAHQARIRVYLGTSAYLILGDVCDGQAHPNIHAAAGGFSYFTPNKTLGMPLPADMPGSHYREYAVPADQIMTIKLYWQLQSGNGAWEHCGPIYQMFTPQPGADYETYMKFEHGICQGLELHRLTKTIEGKVISEFPPLNSLPFRRCATRYETK